MNLKQLRVFCEIVDSGSASAASARLHVATTAISMQLAALEEALGGKLFDRSTRPMRLTTLGAFFHPKAKELLAAAHQMRAQAQEIVSGQLGWLSIGFVRSTLHSLLPSAVHEMRQRYPKVRIDLVEMLSEQQVQGIRDASIHIGVSRSIGAPPQHDDMRYHPLLQDPLVAAVPLHHPLAGRRRLRPQDLDVLPFICFPKDPLSRFAAQSLDYLRERGGAPSVGYEAKEIHTALGLVAAGLGATLVGRTVAAHNRTDVRFIPFQGRSLVTEIYAVHSAQAHLPLVEGFLSILEQHSAALGQSASSATVTVT